MALRTQQQQFGPVTRASALESTRTATPYSKCLRITRMSWRTALLLWIPASAVAAELCDKHDANDSDEPMCEEWCGYMNHCSYCKCARAAISWPTLLC